MDPFDINDKVEPFPLSRAITAGPGIDERLKEVFKPTIEDVDMLEPKRFKQLLKDTHAALHQHSENERNKEVKAAFDHLVALLEENISLQTILDQYMNRIKKA